MINKALDITVGTIDARATRFRNFVVAVAARGLTFVGWAAIRVSWRALLGLFLLEPLRGTFLCLDARRRILVVKRQEPRSCRFTDMAAQLDWASIPGRTKD